MGAAGGKGASAAAIGVGAIRMLVAIMLLAGPLLHALSTAGVVWLATEVLVRSGAGAGGDGEEVE